MIFARILVILSVCGFTACSGTQYDSPDRPSLPTDEPGESEPSADATDDATPPASEELPVPDQAELVFQYRPGFVRVEGHWVWTPTGWSWTPGSYVVDREGFVYVQGRWERQRGRWVWIPGQWVEGRIGYIWQRGYWRIEDGVATWIPGQWVTRRPGFTWERGRWEQRGAGWVWVPGRWRQNDAP